MEEVPRWSRYVRFLIKRLELENCDIYILQHPPEIVKATIDYLISFSDKPRNNNKPPRKQNAWLIFLKNYHVYLRERRAADSNKKKLLMTDVPAIAKVEWEKLQYFDYTK